MEAFIIFIKWIKISPIHSISTNKSLNKLKDDFNDINLSVNILQKKVNNAYEKYDKEYSNSMNRNNTNLIYLDYIKDITYEKFVEKCDELDEIEIILNKLYYNKIHDCVICCCKT
jgi:hypothetical protein